jgi:hypothetical protein
MFPFRLYAATGDAVAQLDSLNGETVDVSQPRGPRGHVRCLTNGGVLTAALAASAGFRLHLLDLPTRVRQSVKSTRLHPWSGQ